MNQTNNNSNLLIFIAFAILVFGVRLYFIHSYGTYMPYWDDWGIGDLLYKYQINELSVADLFQQVNTHRQVFGKLMSLVLFKANNSQWDPYVFMLANSITWIVCGLILLKITFQHSQELKLKIAVPIIFILWLYPISLVNTLWGTQSHVYFMTLFAILGCWYITNKPLTKYWWLAVFCLFAGPLTLSGGSFISVSVASVYLVLLVVDKANKGDHLKTFIVSFLAAIFGLSLIFIQEQTAGSSLFANLFSFNGFLTFAKTMSWPVRTHIWPFLIFLIPIIALLVSIIKNGKVESKLVPFILSMYGFIFLIALSVAAARSLEGAGPPRRYMDFLTLGFIASSFALLFIQQKQFQLPKIINHFLILAWYCAVLISIPYRIETTLFTLNDRDGTIQYQEKYVKQFINTNDFAYLEDKPFRHIPFPRVQTLGDKIKKYQETDILHYSLQKPSLLTHNPEHTPQQWQASAFVPNGFHYPVRRTPNREGWYGENVIGSFFLPKGGNESTGGFESNIFGITRPYIMVPVTGYLNFTGMSLKLIEVDTGKEYPVEPKYRGSTNAENWTEILVNAKKGNYRLVAEDNNEELWFGFAAPRSVGRLSYLTKKLLTSNHFFYIFGIGLLTFIFRRKIISTITK